MSKTEVFEVDDKKMLEIIETRLPLGKFILFENGLYIGCDNETGDAWTEEFESREKCIDWLIDVSLEV